MIGLYIFQKQDIQQRWKNFGVQQIITQRRNVLADIFDHLADNFDPLADNFDPKMSAKHFYVAYWYVVRQGFSTADIQAIGSIWSGTLKKNPEQ